MNHEIGRGLQVSWKLVRMTAEQLFTLRLFIISSYGKELMLYELEYNQEPTLTQDLIYSLNLNNRRLDVFVPSYYKEASCPLITRCHD
ncbi:hypothetical protein Tco_0462756 [Tanacetum coccineum]